MQVKVFCAVMLGSLTLLGATQKNARGNAPDVSRPNIVFFLADDLGYGDPRCLNPDSKIPTPHMDRLADQGMTFTDAHSPSAVCSPTRYGILTGRYCWRTSLQQGVLLPWDRPLIEPDRLTLPAMLKSHGYTTACVGKWHLGWDWPVRPGRPYPTELREIRAGRQPHMEDYADFDFTQVIGNGPITRGFDSYFGTAVPNFPPYCFIEDDRTVGIPTVIKPSNMYGRPGPMVPGWRLEPILPTLTALAVTFIDRHAAQSKNQPFFLYFASTAPHTPIVPDAPFQGESEAGPYGDLVHQVDWTLGQIMAALERNGLLDNTLVIMTSDNGSPARAGDAHLHGEDFVRVNTVTTMFGHHPNAPWRGMKADIWEGGHRVPLFVQWPDRIEAGSTSDETVCHTDFMATIAGILGHDLPDEAAEDSYDILPAMRGQTTGRPIREATVHHSIRGVFSIRQNQWKLIPHLGSGGWTQPAVAEPKDGGPAGQLYDLSKDPGETTNLWQERPDVVRQLTQLLEKYQQENRSVPHRAERARTKNG